MMIASAIGLAAAGAAPAAAAGAAAGGAAAAGAGAAAAGISSSTLFAGASILSGLAGLGQGVMGYAQASEAAGWERARAAEEEAKGAEESLTLARQYREMLGQQAAVQAANGLQLGTGTPGSISEATRRRVDQEIDTTRFNARNAAQARRVRSRGLMQQASSQLVSGIGNAASAGLDYYRVTG